jgi:phage terminase large subunit
MFEASEIYERNRQAYHNEKRVILNEGGTRSTKTYSIVTLLIRIATVLAGKQITVVSQTLPHLKRGALKDFLEVLKKSGLYRQLQYNKTELRYTFRNGSYVEFFSAEDSDRLFGAGRDILFINEANKLPYSSFFQLNMRTRETIFLDYNPTETQSWVYDLADKEDSTLIHSTYKDNPFLGEIQRSVIEQIEDADLARVFKYGLRGINSKGLIYPKFEVIDEIPENYTHKISGLDFGYSPDATALIQIYFAKDYKSVILHEAVYQTHLTNSDLISMFKEQGLPKYVPIVADSSEPQRIEEIHRAGFVIDKAIKGAGSIEAGILNVKRFKIYITRQSVNLKKELEKYSFRTDKNENVTNIPEDKNNHALDAVRYAITNFVDENDLDRFSYAPKTVERKIPNRSKNYRTK